MKRLITLRGFLQPTLIWAQNVLVNTASLNTGVFFPLRIKIPQTLNTKQQANKKHLKNDIWTLPIFLYSENITSFLKLFATVLK
jgi:hypothetical protein